MPQVSLPNYNPPIEGARSALVYTSAQVINDVFPVGATEVAIVVEDSLTLRRQTEIVSAIKFLMNGIRDRRLLEDGGFKGFALYTTVPLDRITESARLTASDNTLVGFGTGVIGIAMGATATDKQFVLPLDTAVDQMIDVLLENIKDQAA